MTVWYTEYSDYLVDEVIEKTGLNECSLSPADFRKTLLVTDEKWVPFVPFFTAYKPLDVDVKLSREDFVKKCVELYQQKKEE